MQSVQTANSLCEEARASNLQQYSLKSTWQTPANTPRRLALHLNRHPQCLRTFLHNRLSRHAPVELLPPRQLRAHNNGLLPSAERHDPPLPTVPAPISEHLARLMAQHGMREGHEGYVAQPYLFHNRKWPHGHGLMDNASGRQDLCFIWQRDLIHSETGKRIL
jgi:hypothetical protein